MYPAINMKATGIRLRLIMEWKNITVKDVQQYLGLACVQSVYRWLSGRSLPSIDNLYALSQLLQMPIDCILVGTREYPAPDGDNPYHVRMFAYYGAVSRQWAA